MCARHGAVLGGENPLYAVGIGSTSLGQGVHREVRLFVGLPRWSKNPCKTGFTTHRLFPPATKRGATPTPNGGYWGVGGVFWELELRIDETLDIRFQARKISAEDYADFNG